MDMNVVCRTCLLPRQGMMCIFSLIQDLKSGFTKPVLDILNIFTEISISRKDSTPDKICKNCFDQVHKSYKFKMKLEKSGVILKQLKENGKGIECINPNNEHSVEEPDYIEVIKTEHSDDYTSSNDKQIENCNIPTVLEPEIMRQVTFLKQEVKQECEIEIIDEGTSDVSLSEESDLECPIAHVDGKVNKRKFKCATCSKLFGYKSNLTIHMRIHSDEKPFQCEVCPKTFRFSSSLRVHKLKIHGDGSTMKFKCTSCSKRYLTRYELNRHMKIHPEKKSFDCEVCQMNFRCKNSWSLHIKVEHADKKFKCTTCSKLFLSKFILNRHILSHTNERPFQCEICQKRVRSKANLRIHSKTVHGDETTMKFKCTTCSKLHICKSELNKHMIVHSEERPYQCEICQKNFRYKTHLTEHVKIHDDQHGTHKCTTCSKLFSSKYSLKQHVRIHTGEKPFQCEVCSRKFLNKNYLKAHMQRMHESKS